MEILWLTRHVTQDTVSGNVSNIGKRRLVAVPDEVWDRVVVRAAEEKRQVREVVTNALRMYLAGGGSVAQESSPGERLAPRPGPAVGSAVDRIRRALEVVAPGTTLDVTASADPSRGKVTTERVGLSPKEVARRREARRGDHEGSQDPRDEEGC